MKKWSFVCPPTPLCPPTTTIVELVAYRALPDRDLIKKIFNLA
jgi:hypothetical protein